MILLCCCLFRSVDDDVDVSKKRKKLYHINKLNISDHLVSEWLLLNANSAIFQLYHGENKLIVNEMMMRSDMY
jgi:hypothetical protein